MLGEQKLQAIAKKVLGLSRASETEVLLMVTDHGLTRFANSQIHQNVAWQDLGISVRVVDRDLTTAGARIGVASGNSFHPYALKDVIKRASELVKLQKEDPYFKGLPQAQKIPEVKIQINQVTPQQRANAVSTIINKSKSHNVVVSGSFDSAVTEIAVANSKGVWAYHISSSADISTILLGPTSTGFAAQVGRSIENIDAEKVAQQALEKVLRGRKPSKVKPGEWDIILEPQAVNEMMTFFSWLGPNARIYHEQASYFSGKLGKKVVGKNINIVDDPLDESAFPMPFDFEGVPKRKLEIIKKGVLANLVYDSYHAAKYGGENTGHALPAPNVWGPMPLHLTILPGERTLEQMIKKVKRGLLVTRLWYVRTLNPRSLVLTGMTRDGTFLIENGEMVGGVKNMRFNQGIPEALNNIAQISSDTIPLSSFETELGINRMPALHIKGWKFTSGTEF